MNLFLKNQFSPIISMLPLCTVKMNLVQVFTHQLLFIYTNACMQSYYRDCVNLININCQIHCILKQLHFSQLQRQPHIKNVAVVKPGGVEGMDAQGHRSVAHIELTLRPKLSQIV